MPIEPGPEELSGAELRLHLEREARLLAPEDQARLLRLIKAMENGATIDAESIRGLDPAQLREWSDELGQPKC